MPRVWKKKQRPSATPGAPKPRSRVETILKWVGGLTALLSLLFGLQQLIQLLSDVRERQRQVAESYEVGKLQQEAGDYEGAWASFEQALQTAEAGDRLVKLTGRLGDERRTLREAQEDLAMEWLRNARVSEGRTFSEIVAPLFPVLSRGVAGAEGARKADLLAHVGWANFLRWRDGQAHLDPAQHYRQALAVDPGNPYAHAHWGHWLLWRQDALAEARQHFSAALASGRARAHVRRMQFAALENLGTEGEGAFLAAMHDMWKHGEAIDPGTRNEAYNLYSFACGIRYQEDRFKRLRAAVPLADQLAMFQALYYGEDFDNWRRAGRDACLATLLEAVGQREEALRIWQKLRPQFPPQDGGGLGDRAVAAVERLSPDR